MDNDREPVGIRGHTIGLNQTETLAVLSFYYAEKYKMTVDLTGFQGGGKNAWA